MPQGAWNSAAQSIECYSSPKNRGDALHAPRSELPYPVTEANENLVGVAPNTTDVLNERQITFGEPANLSFTVNSEPTISVAYDLHGDRALQDPTGTTTTPRSLPSLFTQRTTVGF
jgi:hypothetical protein